MRRYRTTRAAGVLGAALMLALGACESSTEPRRKAAALNVTAGDLQTAR